ncbi:MAG: DUF3375 family protein [Pirellulaceae bacterium]
MQIAPLQRFFHSSPAMHLLRSPNAPWIVAFLHQQFKSSGQITWLHSPLAAQLETTLRELQAETNGAPQTRLSGEAYLNNWSSGDCRWLKRFIDESHPEPVYQLTPDAELVLAFVSKATRTTTFIGTQSHLRSILGLLQEVVDEALPSEDAHAIGARIEQLEREREVIEQKLNQLRRGQASEEDLETGKFPTAERRATLEKHPEREARERSHRMRSQFDMAVAQFDQLKSEFRGVEEHFKSITRGVQQRLLQTQDSRGAILEFALDAEDLLKSSDPGRSFADFLKLVHDPASQAHLTELVSRLTQLESLADRHEELQSIRTMLPSLLGEAEKILRTTQHLSLTLRRLLDTRSNRHHRQLAHLLRDIRAAASQHSESPPLDVGLEIEVELEIQLPIDRPFWSTPDPFVEVEWQLVDSDPLEHAAALQQLVSLQRIDWQNMRRNITLALKSNSHMTIQALLDRFPIQTGSVELLGYLQIAHEDGHEIDRSQSIELFADWEGSRARVLRMPRVVFHRVRRDWASGVRDGRRAGGTDDGASGYIEDDCARGADDGASGHIEDDGLMATKTNAEVNVE